MVPVTTNQHTIVSRVISQGQANSYQIGTSISWDTQPISSLYGGQNIHMSGTAHPVWLMLPCIPILSQYYRFPY